MRHYFFPQLFRCVCVLLILRCVGKQLIAQTTFDWSFVFVAVMQMHFSGLRQNQREKADSEKANVQEKILGKRNGEEREGKTNIGDGVTPTTVHPRKWLWLCECTKTTLTHSFSPSLSPSELQQAAVAWQTPSIKSERWARSLKTHRHRVMVFIVPCKLAYTTVVQLWCKNMQKTFTAAAAAAGCYSAAVHTALEGKCVYARQMALSFCIFWHVTANFHWKKGGKRLFAFDQTTTMHSIRVWREISQFQRSTDWNSPLRFTPRKQNNHFRAHSAQSTNPMVAFSCNAAVS